MESLKLKGNETTTNHNRSRVAGGVGIRKSTCEKIHKLKVLGDQQNHDINTASGLV